MVRETRHLWVGNLPDNIREDRIREHFKRYGRVQNVKLLGRMESPSASTNTNSGVCATVAFMDIKSASKAHNVEHVLDERTLTTEYYEPAAIPSSAGAPSAGSSPAGSGYSGSSSSVNSAPAPASTPRYHLSGEESAGNACAMAASAAAPATWRGTNDSATDFCRRGNTPAAYGRTTPHHRWYAGTGTTATTATSTGTGTGAAGIESTPSTPGGGTERRRRLSGSGSSRSESSSPEPSDTSRASTPAAHHVANHNARRTPPPPHQWPSTANGRPLAICVRNLPTRSTDSSLKDGLYHEYKKHGKVVWVKVVGQNADRYAVVRFKKPSDVEKALEVSQDKLFFGCKISVAPHQSCDDDAESAKPYETDIDEYHPKATRTLFIGNLEKDVTQQQLRDKFKHFGRIIEIDIKKGSGGGAGYAFCQYASISSVVEAIRAMDGEYVGSSRVKLGFGKPVATTCVWVDGLTEHTEKQVLGAVSRCGAATSVCVDRAAGAALVHFEQAAAAGGAVRELRRVAAQLSAAEPDHPRLCVDYASRECQEAFYEQLEKHGGSAALAGAERSSVEATSRYLPTARHESLRVYDEPGSSPQTDEATYEDRLQSVVVSPHRALKHRRDSSTEDRKHSKERHRSVGGGSRRSRSGSRGHISRRRHRRRRDGSGSRGSHASRTGTPLRDELDAIPTEPRRPPRERPPLPMSLPLPKFAVQLLRAVPTQPRLLPPAPASPPRPPSVSSSSGGSAPHSPSLEERIRSLDEKYERWTGSRAHADAPDRARLRHRLLELDINEVKPSEVVLSLLAKRSVFDEDSERLEGVRVPSPGGSPRSLPTPLSRVLRYPIPVYTQTVNSSMTTSNVPGQPDTERIQPLEPEDNELTLIEKQFKADIENDARLRRTPSIDKSTLDIMEKKHSPTIEKFDVVNHTKRRNSVIVADDKTLAADVKPGIIELKPLIPELRLEKINLVKPLESIMILDVKEKSLKEARPNCEERVAIKKESVDKKISFKTNPIQSNPIARNFQQNCSREVTKLKHDETKLIKEIQIELNRTEKFFFCKNDFDIKAETSIQEDIKQQLEQESKLHETSLRLKNEAERCQEKPFQNNVVKETVSYRIHTNNHLNFVSSIELSKRAEVSNPENKYERTKEKIDVISIFSTKDENNKSKEDNIESEKLVDKVKVPTDILFSPDRTSTESGKGQEEHSKNDREKFKHNRDRVDIEKEKSKINKGFKLERNDKERKIKDDNLNTKPLHEKVERVKTEKENEIVIEKERDFDKAKTYQIEEKLSRHDNHKKEKEKKRELSEVDILTKTIKRDEKNYKHEKPRKDNENKRDIKKEPETSKNRKSSRDESRNICRKDSTDSTTSRASHDSTTTKSRDLENIELKEESKFKTKYFDIEFKDESGKEYTRLYDQGQLENKTRIKTEAKEAKDFVEQHLKNKIKEEKDYSDRYYKSKIESYIDSTPKCKTEVSEKQRHYSLDSPSVDSKRKERLNSCSSLPSHIGHKRRMSSQDSIDYSNEDTKKIKSDKRDSKDLRSLERHKTTKFSKGHFAKIIESKTKDDKKNQVKPPDDNENKNVPAEKNKSLKKSPLVDIEDKLAVSSDASSESLQNNIDFLATLELRSSEEDERQKALRKEMKEKKRIQQLQQIQELQMQQDALQHAELTSKTKDDRKQKHEEKKKDAVREKRMSTERKSRDDKNDQSKRRNRKLHSTDSSDSDEPKKHSIFDIIDDGPCLSMYDKVKARSCKNMQKQEEEKRQEKIKAKFSQLKQSRAKREEKKRSSWDEDSDSENDRRKSHKTSIDTSSDDDQVVIKSKKREKSHGSSLEFDLIRTNDYFDMVSNEEDSSHHKLSRKNSRSRILSDSSDEENIKRCLNKSPSFIDKIKKEIFSDSESSQKSREIDLILKETSDDKIKKTSLLNLFGKSDSEDNRLKTNLDIESDYRLTFPKNYCNDISSENESLPSNRNSCEIRKKHKKKQKKYKFSYSDEEIKLEDHDIILEGIKHKHTDKSRRHSNKKDKRKDKIHESVDTDEPREEKMKFKRDKFSPNQSYDVTSEPLINNSRKDGKMEDIFGPLSDESDKEIGTFSNKTEFDQSIKTGLIDKVASNSDELRNKEDCKRKKDKKRKERRHFTKDDDNSLDVDAVSKAIEASLFAETSNLEDNRTEINDVDGAGKSSETELKYIDNNYKEDLVNSNKYDKIKKESRDKKKKKKKNKEDRQSRKEYYHDYHLEKSQKTDDSYIENNTQLSPKTMLLDIPLPNDIQKVELVDKSDDSKSLSKSPSLPRITDSPPSVANSDVNNEFMNNGSDTPNRLIMDDAMVIDYDLTENIEVNDIPMPPPIDNIVQDISEVPLPKDPPIDVEKSKSILSSFDHEIEVVTDLRSSEDAVRSITNIDIEPDKQGDKINNDAHSKIEKKTEEKPRAIISQEETEDAVAALLGESFGGKTNTFVNCYEEVENNTKDQIEIERIPAENENIPEEDAEEMRQAVQNLNASEMEIKPGTPVSDNDDLLIDTDNEEADENTQDAIERLPINIISTNPALNNNSKVNLPQTNTEVSNLVITKQKPNIVHTKDSNESKKSVEDILKPIYVKSIAKQDNVQQVTSTATPVITSWTLSNNKLIEPQVLNIPVSSMSSRDNSDNKPSHITANILQIKASQNQHVQIGNSARPVISANKAGAPYQVINQIIRPQVTCMQPPTIKIPEPHVIYQKPQGIVISPRMANETLLLSPKTNHQAEGITSPRLSNMTILSTSPQNMNSVGLASPNSIQRRSPGQVTVVRMQQPPLSPIQTMHIPHGSRALVSPNRPNSVLVQAQGTPIHFNRLPVTPVLGPIPKQLNANIIHQSKGNVGNSPMLHQPKIITGDNRKTENLSETAKIILSPTRLQQSSNPIVAKNRLISMQNALHVGSINSALHISNKVLVKNKGQLLDKRENQCNKTEQNHKTTHAPTPIIHVASVNHSSPSIIQGTAKPVMCSLKNAVTVNRGHGSNVIHTINSQRLLTTSPMCNVIQLDTSKSSPPPSVLSMTTIRPSILGKSESNTVVVTTSSLTNVVMTPLLLKGSSSPKPTVRLHSRSESEHIESMSCISHKRDHDYQRTEQSTDVINESITTLNNSPVPVISPMESTIAKCETDFEELLKDNTNEIKKTNHPEKKVEINVGRNITIISQNHDRRKSIENVIGAESINKSVENVKNIENTQSTENNHSTENTKITENIKCIENMIMEKNQSLDYGKNEIETPTSDTLNENQIVHNKQKDLITLDIKPVNCMNECNTSKEEKNDTIIPIVQEATDKNKSPHNNDDKCMTMKVEENKNQFFGLLSDQNQDSFNEIKNIDESDYWSAKDVNIESVIKKVDSLCKDTLNEKKEAIEDTDSKPNDKGNDVEINIPNDLFIEDRCLEICKTESSKDNKDEINEVTIVTEDPIMERSTQSVKRGGRNSSRGKKSEKTDRIQARQILKSARGTSKRGRGRVKVNKKIKDLFNSNLNNIPGDVYDFHEDSGDEAVTSPNKTEARPRLILTIKSPLSGHSNSIATSTLSITQKDQVKKDQNKLADEVRLCNVSASTINTRKSRRLQEKDILRSTVDDVIDDVIKGSSAQFKSNTEPNRKRTTRQAGVKTITDKVSPSDIRKSPRAMKRTRDRRLSEASVGSGDENAKRQDTVKEAKIPKLPEAIELPKSEEIKTTVVSNVAPTTNPTPIMKPPKKMISEISAKLACAFQATTNANSGNRIGGISPNVAERPTPSTERQPEIERVVAGVDLIPVVPEPISGDAGYGRRIVDNVPTNMMPVGATEATDARVQSPALPHRPPSAHRPPDRVTPILVRGGEGDGSAGVAVAAAASASRFRGAYAGPASLPRGAHHPLQPHQSSHAKQVAVALAGPQQHHPGSRVAITSVPSVSPQGQMPMGEGMYPHFSQHHYQMYQQHFRATQYENVSTHTTFPTRSALEAEGSEAPTPPLELRRPPSARVPRPAHSPSPHDRHIMYGVRCGRSPPPAHGTSRPPSALPPPGPPGPPHASQVPREADSLQMLLRRYPVMWQGLLALKNDSAAVQMHFVGGNPGVAADALARNADGTAASLLRIAQRMRLEPAQLDQVHRKMKLENEHCTLLALPCGRDHMDVLQQSTNLTAGFITYLQRKQAAGIVNVAPPGHQQSLYTVHIFPSCDFANENLNRIAPDLMHRVANIAHLLIVIATAIG